MQPKSNAILDKKSFDLLKRNIKNISMATKGKGLEPGFATDMPESVAIKLTNRCNMRCKHCYQWNDSGHHRFLDTELQNMDIDFSIIEKVFEETKSNKARFYFWGGEPLFYKDFDKIAMLMEKDPREAVLCTNGVLIPQHIDSILKMGPYLEILMAVEGFEEEHDAIRGKGSFEKVMKSIDLLVELRKKGLFHGKIYIHTMINDGMVNKLYKLLEFFQSKGIDFVILCFPWYLSQETSDKMDEYFEEKFSWLKKSDNVGQCSWHAFKYKLEKTLVPDLMKEIEKINQNVWNIKVRYQPGLEFNEMEDFILGKDHPGQNIKRCLALCNRTDIGPDGSVSACKQFFEFTVGNLKTQSLREIWKGESYDKIRKLLCNELMPVCSMCNVLYLNSI